MKKKFRLRIQPREKIFLFTWIAYAGFYFCRKNFSVAMPLMEKQLGLDNMQLANLITCYSIMYMAGQFISGFLNDRLGPRMVVTGGLLLAVISNLFLGLLPSMFFLTGSMLINGAGQSTGWSGNLRIMSNWYEQRERGIVMGWWTTCYVAGGFLAVLFATWWGTNSILPQLGWRKVFWAPALLLALISWIFYRNIRNNPDQTNIQEIKNKEKAFKETGTNLKSVLLNPALWLVGGMYFFTKFIRYSFLFWLPLYFTQRFGYSDQVAGYTSSAFELTGFFGIITAGYLSDKLFGSGRFSVSALFLFFLGLLFILQPWLAHFGYWGNVITVAVAGFLIYGPDSLMSAAAAMDIGKGTHTGVSTGFINGMGSAGQLLSPYAVAYISKQYGWDSLFKVFLIMSVLAGFLLALKWNYGIVHKIKFKKTITPDYA